MHMIEVRQHTRRGPGRPRGSKNKPKVSFMMDPNTERRITLSSPDSPEYAKETMSLLKDAYYTMKASDIDKLDLKLMNRIRDHLFPDPKDREIQDLRDKVAKLENAIKTVTANPIVGKALESELRKLEARE